MTPEAVARTVRLDRIEDRVTVSRASLDEVHRSLNTGTPAAIDLVTFGCPHASLGEVQEIAGLLQGKRLRPGVELWVCTSRGVKDVADRLGYVRAVESAGGHVVADTCMVVSPIESMGHQVTATNSGKAAKYLPRFCQQKVVLGSAQEILEKVVV